MIGIIKLIAGPLFGSLLYGLIDLFFPSVKAQAVQSAGGAVVANVMLWGAIGSFFAYVGIRDKSADTANPTIISRFLGLIRSAFVAVLAGVCKLFIEAAAKAKTGG